MTEKELTRELVSDDLHGRRKIMVNAGKVTSANVVDILNKALPYDKRNQLEINYLYDVYRGIMDIRGKTKTVREENNNKVTINIPNKIVTFKSAFLLSSPIQYISASDDKDVSEKVAVLNAMMRAEDKESKDKECVDWIHIAGVAPRMVLPDPEGEKEGSPAAIYTLDPREAFVIYSSKIGKKPLAGVLKQYDDNDEEIYNVYVPDGKFVISNDEIIEQTFYDYGRVPVVEYINNEARMGSFETVLSPINQINMLESCRVDNVVDFVNAYDVFQNCEIEKDQYGSLSAGGQYIMIRSFQGEEAKVYRISSELSQNGTQTEINALYNYITEITGLPNRNGGSSTSDTGQAVIYRDGWEDANSRASDTEKLYIRSEREILKVLLKIYREKGVLDLDPADVQIQFTRKNLTDIQSKAQVLCELLASDKVHPHEAYVYSGMFADPETAYRHGMEWYKEQEENVENELKEEIERERSVYNNGQDDNADESQDNQAVQ